MLFLTFLMKNQKTEHYTRHTQLYSNFLCVIFFSELESRMRKAQFSKIRKKCNFKSAKKHYLHFQKWQKINFCTRKKFKITKNAIIGLKKKTQDL